MHPCFRVLVARARALGLEVIDRCNLTILHEPGYRDLPEFFAQNGVTVIASLRCYTKENVESQRGRDVFDRSIEALGWLNGLGYGRPSPLGDASPESEINLSPARRSLSPRSVLSCSLLNPSSSAIGDKSPTRMRMPLIPLAASTCHDDEQSPILGNRQTIATTIRLAVQILLISFPSPLR